MTGEVLWTPMSQGQRTVQFSNKAIIAEKLTLGWLLEHNAVCCICETILNACDSPSLYRHPRLKVLVCSRCSSGRDHDHFFNVQNCMWCGRDVSRKKCNAGEPEFRVCSYANCLNKICKECISANFTKAQIGALRMGWNCPECHPESIAPHQLYADILMEFARMYKQPVNPDRSSVLTPTSSLRERFRQSSENLRNMTQITLRKLEEHIELARELLTELSSLHGAAEERKSNPAMFKGPASAEIVPSSATLSKPRNRAADSSVLAEGEESADTVLLDSDEETTVDRDGVGPRRHANQLEEVKSEKENEADSNETLDLNSNRTNKRPRFTATEDEYMHRLLGSINRRHFSKDKTGTAGVEKVTPTPFVPRLRKEKVYEEPFLSTDEESDDFDAKQASGPVSEISGCDCPLIIVSSEDELLVDDDDDDEDDEDGRHIFKDSVSDEGSARTIRETVSSEDPKTRIGSTMVSARRRRVPSMPRAVPAPGSTKEIAKKKSGGSETKRDSVKRKYSSDEGLSENSWSDLESVSDQSLNVPMETDAPLVDAESSPKKNQKGTSPAWNALESGNDSATDNSGRDLGESTDESVNATKTPTPAETDAWVISSDDDDDDSIRPITEVSVKTEPATSFGRKNIREVISKAQLSKATIEANLREKERRKRIEENQRIYNHFELADMESGEEPKCVLEFDVATKEPLVQVLEQLSKRMKFHQVEGVKFLYQNLVESSAKLLENSPGTGAILGHCMGLGKSFQVVCLLHTLMTHPKLKDHFRTVLLISPLNVIASWREEISRWVLHEPEITEKLTIFTLHTETLQTARLRMLSEWQGAGGIMIITPNLLTKLLGHETQAGQQGARPKQFPDSRATERFKEFLCDPGPQMLIVDEGHTLKNDMTQLTQIVDKMIKTSRKVLLTGTPLQNNLIEYYTMVSIVSPHLLGTKSEFRNRFENPIMNGQYKNSTRGDIRKMRQRASVLKKLLENVVHRRDLSILQSILPPRRDYVITVRLSRLQEALYEKFLGMLRPTTEENGRKLLKSLLQDYISLRSVWTHPKLLTMPKKFLKKKRPVTTVSDALGFDSISPNAALAQEANRDWFQPFIENQDLDNLALGPKIFLLCEIIQQCGIIGDKLVVFCTQLSALDLIEFTLGLMHTDSNHEGSWIIEKDYFRMDGSTGAEDRHRFFKMFNNTENSRARLFLVSTNAGKLGSTLIGANRMVLLDTSWNPADDNQAVYRIYRIGQSKPVYIYRFVAFQTMEEKIYARNILKECTSYRVLDDSNKERHFTYEDVRDLYTFAPYDESNRQTPSVPQDKMLAELILRHQDLIVDVHEHQQMLQSLEDDLSEEDRRIAWDEYLREKERPPPTSVPIVTEFLKSLGISSDPSSINERRTVDSFAEYWNRAGITDSERLEIAPSFRNASTRCREHLFKVRKKTEALMSEINRRGNLSEDLKERMALQTRLFDAEDAHFKRFISEIDQLIQRTQRSPP